MTNPEELSLREAIEILSAHNDWRRGLSDTPTNPTRLGKAIDIAIEAARTATPNAPGFNPGQIDSLCESIEDALDTIKTLVEQIRLNGGRIYRFESGIAAIEQGLNENK